MSSGLPEQARTHEEASFDWQSCARYSLSEFRRLSRPGSSHFPLFNDFRIYDVGDELFSKIFQDKAPIRTAEGKTRWPSLDENVDRKIDVIFASAFQAGSQESLEQSLSDYNDHDYFSAARNELRAYILQEGKRLGVATTYSVDQLPEGPKKEWIQTIGKGDYLSKEDDGHFHFLLKRENSEQIEDIDLSVLIDDNREGLGQHIMEAEFAWEMYDISSDVIQDLNIHKKPVKDTIDPNIDRFITPFLPYSPEDVRSIAEFVLGTPIAKSEKEYDLNHNLATVMSDIQYKTYKLRHLASCPGNRQPLARQYVGLMQAFDQVYRSGHPQLGDEKFTRGELSSKLMTRPWHMSPSLLRLNMQEYEQQVERNTTMAHILAEVSSMMPEKMQGKQFEEYNLQERVLQILKETNPSLYEDVTRFIGLDGVGNAFLKRAGEYMWPGISTELLDDSFNRSVTNELFYVAERKDAEDLLYQTREGDVKFNNPRVRDVVMLLALSRVDYKSQQELFANAVEVLKERYQEKAAYSTKQLQETSSAVDELSQFLQRHNLPFSLPEKLEQVVRVDKAVSVSYDDKYFNTTAYGFLFNILAFAREYGFDHRSPILIQMMKLLYKNYMSPEIIDRFAQTDFFTYEQPKLPAPSQQLPEPVQPTQGWNLFRLFRRSKVR